MKAGKMVSLLILFVAIIFATQYLFIAYLPNLIFMIAKHRSGVSLNTVIHAPKTDAKLRKVVLPNPDFIYSVCFYDATEKDILFTGLFADSTQYCSLAFYGNNVQPYYVRNNQVGLRDSFRLRLSTVNRARCDLTSPTKQGAALLRILVTDSIQMQKALALQQAFKIQELNQND